MPLSPKRGNKDYYKGTRQASLPGLRTGAPGKYFGRGRNAYRILDERVRVFVAPPVDELNNSRLKPYVPWMTYLTPEQMLEQPFGKLPPGGLTGQIYLDTVQGRRQVAETGLVARDAEGEPVTQS